jgi:hypothetical protein
VTDKYRLALEASGRSLMYTGMTEQSHEKLSFMITGVQAKIRNDNLLNKNVVCLQLDQFVWFVRVFLTITLE